MNFKCKANSCVKLDKMGAVCYPLRSEKLHAVSGKTAMVYRIKGYRYEEDR